MAAVWRRFTDLCLCSLYSDKKKGRVQSSEGGAAWVCVRGVCASRGTKRLSCLCFIFPSKSVLAGPILILSDIEYTSLCSFCCSQIVLSCVCLNVYKFK